MKLKVNNFNLKDTITCGQIFRYEIEEDNSFTVMLPDRVINIKQVDDEIIFDSNKLDKLEEVIKKYFDLDFDYVSINNSLLDSNKELKEIITYSSGLKMINGSKLEVIISYIISANNRVPQIKKVLDNISEKYGEEVIFKNKKYYLFPTLASLTKATISDFRELKAGFRDKYLYEIISKINNNEFDIDLIDNLDSYEALKYLMNNNGIGEKVASCILLFAYHRLDVFPIDTWVKKYMKDEYNITDIKKIREFTKEKYKDYSGIVIQYMFNYKRNNKNLEV